MVSPFEWDRGRELTAKGKEDDDNGDRERR
jgi:hypothetical protein